MFKGILSEIILKQTYFEEIDLFVKEKIGFQPLPVKKIKKDRTSVYRTSNSPQFSCCFKNLF